MLFNPIDIILIFLIIYLCMLGFMRGFLRSLIGPISFTISSVLAMMVYSTTHQALNALITGIVGQIAISLGLRFLILPLFKPLDPDAKPSLLSRLSGSLITLIWGWAFITLFGVLFYLIASTPNSTLNQIQHISKQSVIFQRTILPFTVWVIPPEKKSSEKVDLMTLYNDPKLAPLFNDPEIREAAEKKDFSTLLKNPKVMALAQDMMNDPSLMQKMMKAFAQLKKEGLAAKP